MMAIELEYKLHIDDAEQLEQVMTCTELVSLRVSEWKEFRMQTSYFDAPDGRFAARHWTLRRRMENDESIICLKTPLPEQNARGEWQLAAQTLDLSVVERLLQAGAPQELLWMYGDGTLSTVCGAEFVRRSAMLEFPDGSRAEVSGDVGRLFGPTQSLPFCELELEMYAGEPTLTLELVHTLCRKFGLHMEPKSKVARARELT